METGMTVNGVSVCAKGEERYEQFEDLKGKLFLQYDYRTRDGELFSTVALTLEQCRIKRDKWLQAKNFKQINPNILKKIEGNKRLSKSEMGYQIGKIEPYHVASISTDFFLREEIVTTFNQMFGTEIK